jgi:hypothetical protein
MARTSSWWATPAAGAGGRQDFDFTHFLLSLSPQIMIGEFKHE